MNQQKDSKGNIYYDINNIRITCVPETWNGGPGLRLQAYKQEGGLHLGAEIPVPSKSAGYDLLNAIHKALDHVDLQ